MPPEFAPYEAEHFDVGNGNIVSHDPHLNTDGEALYRFLLSQAQTPPKLSLHCRGTHSETRSRNVTRQGRDGQHHVHTESYSETVVDFDFYISLDKYVLPEVTHWSVSDVDPAYRGRMFKDVGSEPRKAKYNERKLHNKWVKHRDAQGLPPWISSESGVLTDDYSVVLKSSKSLRAWADDYCASPKNLKEFVYVKSLYGWDLQTLEQAIRTSINGASFYSGSLTVEFEKSATKVYVRPDNRLSRMLSNKWLKFLSIILLIFPFIWLFKRFNKRGGGRWEVCGGAYALKRWVPQEPVETGKGMSDSILRAQGSGEVRRLVGCREADWLKEWESTITRAVAMRYESTIPLTRTSGEVSRDAVALIDML
ncbi:hypothetical protein BDZ89DRAFT_1194718 [Hymenopellis radicata]|nr:hypothetical protein BDZ89DRAFT_1194718 [Hymenopellis radicata]